MISVVLHHVVTCDLSGRCVRSNVVASTNAATITAAAATAAAAAAATARTDLAYSLGVPIISDTTTVHSVSLMSRVDFLQIHNNTHLTSIR